MASPGHEYTLVGFSNEVDRRPLVFVEPLPSQKVCSACGLVPKAIALHSCQHNFCKPCYEQSLRHDKVVCPLDGEDCLEGEVSWINYNTLNVMKKEVLCWNHRNGCNVVTAAADIARHFPHECRHHSVRCPKCSAEILASDVCRHLESRCDASREPGAAAVQPGTVPQEPESLVATHSEISDGCRQRDNAKSTAMSSQNSAEAPEAHTESSSEALFRIAWAKNSTPEDRQYALTLLPSKWLSATTHMCELEVDGLLRKRADIENDFVEEMAAPVYLCGYCVSIGVRCNTSKLEGCLLFELHKGEVDRYLEWPFNLLIRWRILHPDGKEKVEYCVTTNRSILYDFLRTNGRSDSRIRLCSKTFSTKDLESHGFIMHDKLRLRLSLETPPAYY